MEKEVRVKIPEEIYNKIIENYGSISEGIRDIIEKHFVGSITSLAVKPKIITVKHKTTCISCKKQVKEGETGLWLKGLGVICKHCILNYVKEKITSKDYSKLILKLEIELERLKTIRNELRREISENIRKYYILSSQVSLLETMKKIGHITQVVEDTILHFTEMKKEEFVSKLNHILEKIDGLREEISRMQIPKTWIQKLMKELGVKIEIEKPVREKY